MISDRPNFMRFFIALSLVFACLSSLQAQSVGQPPIKWRTIAEGSTSQIKRAENHFMHTSGDIQTWWRKHSGTGAETVPYKFDPNKEFCVAIYLGERKTGGYRIYVETVARSTPATGIIATVELTPSRGSTTTQALTQPWVLIAIERPGIQEWQFRRVTAIDPMPSIGGGSKCCGCSKCKCSKEIWYDPTPLGQYSIDNSYGIRPLGKVPFAPFDSGTDSDIGRESSFVIQSERQYEDYWSKHRSESRRIPQSRIDWSREQLLAVHLGTTPTTGFELQIVGIERTWQRTLNVLYAVKPPESGRRIDRSWHSPFAIVRMSRITEPLVFVRRDDLLSSGACNCCSKCKH
jgi:hypothetical protein